ncbi:hypothetical protein KGF54_003094 [Candida jiufengensis]|uniref:uncharacterized protein n=1 Tax=Candida jiufengensis TaxID=497108 RepID=UPI002225260E|nr:uncharacterized protein KGF54_003094 [Candida jiufengensis]KAI5952228.1 hypothetical protein KGF54_003094 [Candida jiufengensis]
MFRSNSNEFVSQNSNKINSNSNNNFKSNNLINNNNNANIKHDLFFKELNSSKIIQTNLTNNGKKDSKLTTSSISSSSSSNSNSNSLIDFNKNDLLPELWQTSSNDTYLSSDSLDYLTIKQDLTQLQQQQQQHHHHQQPQQLQQPQLQTSFALDNYLSQPQSPPTLKQFPNLNNNNSNFNVNYNHHHQEQHHQQQQPNQYSQESPLSLQFSSPKQQLQPLLQSPIQSNFNSIQPSSPQLQNYYLSQQQELNSSLWKQQQPHHQQQQQMGYYQEQLQNNSIQSPEPFLNSTTLQQIYLLDEEVQSRKKSIIEYTQLDDNLQQQQLQLQFQQLQLQQEQQQQQQNKLKPINTQLYKTELCQAFMRMGVCPYGLKCQFAHGEQELKYVERPPKWRSKPCSNWSKFGSCRYGNRCCFKHSD